MLPFSFLCRALLFVTDFSCSLCSPLHLVIACVCVFFCMYFRVFDVIIVHPFSFSFGTCSLKNGGCIHAYPYEVFAFPSYCLSLLEVPENPTQKYISLTLSWA